MTKIERAKRNLTRAAMDLGAAAASLDNVRLRARFLELTKQETERLTTMANRFDRDRLWLFRLAETLD
jgi:hypothetical protein